MSNHDEAETRAEVTTPTDVSDTKRHVQNEVCAGPSQGESKPPGPSQGESEPPGPSQGESASSGASQEESDPSGASQGESCVSLNTVQGEKETCDPSRGESEPSSGEEENETVKTGTESDMATRGQFSGLAVTEPASDASGKIGTDQPPSRVILEAYTSRASLVCGILQIILGVAAVGLTIGLISFWEKVHYARDGMGIFGGVLFMVSGISGIIAAYTRRRRFIITCMILSILAALFSGILPAFTFVHAAFNHKIWHGFAAILCAITAVSFLEMVVSIVQSAMCCRVTCCATPPSACKSAGISCTAESNYTV